MGQYQTGTVNLTNGSPVVTGNSTNWSTSVISVGDLFSKYGETAIYQIASIDSTSQITLTTNYVGTDSTSVYYEITTDWTPNFSLAEISAGDRDWPIHLTVGMIRKLDTLLGYRLQGIYNKTIDSTADFTITYPNYENKILQFSGSIGSTVNIIVPLIPYRQWIVYNGNTGSIIIKGATGSGVTIESGKRCIIYSNGTDIVRVTADT